MAGRRLRNAVKEVLTSSGQFNDNVYIVIAGLTNSYSQYVTTFEEYQIQRYEVCVVLSLRCYCHINALQLTCLIVVSVLSTFWLSVLYILLICHLMLD